MIAGLHNGAKNTQFPMPSVRLRQTELPPVRASEA
jgi:hypothetical protein